MYEVAQTVKLPIIGIGGIASAEDALEFLLAGATAVQVGTANFINPSIGVMIAEGVRAYCEQQRISDVNELVGSLRVSKENSVMTSWL